MTSIEWTDETWNPVLGCTIVSAGCEHCYAMGVAHRGLSPEHRGLTVLRAHGKGPRWNGSVRFFPERLAAPLGWKKPRRVFVNSMSDLFHAALTFEQIAAVFGVMAATPQHTYQVLTKRPEQAREFFEWLRDQGEELEAEVGEAPPSGSPLPSACAIFAKSERLGEDGWRAAMRATWPLPNVWLGVSVEDQKTADERIPVLLGLPAAIRWVSYEPAIGPIDFAGAEGGSDYLGDPRDGLEGEAGIDWIVVGGESGPGARPFDIAWARSTVRACAAAGVPCFVKQLGGHPGYRMPIAPLAPENDWLDIVLKHGKGADPAEWDEDLRVRQWPEARS